jgi:hypothetical protein
MTFPIYGKIKFVPNHQPVLDEFPIKTCISTAFPTATFDYRMLSIFGV